MGYTIHYTSIEQLRIPIEFACSDQQQALDHACLLQRHGQMIEGISGNHGERISPKQILAYRLTKKLPNDGKRLH
jgi:hypothetical protein